MEAIIAKLEAGSFEEAVKMIEALESVGSQGARALQSSEWFGVDGSALFKVDYDDGCAESVQIVGSMRMFSR